MFINILFKKVPLLLGRKHIFNQINFYLYKEFALLYKQQNLSYNRVVTFIVVKAFYLCTSFTQMKAQLPPFFLWKWGHNFRGKFLSKSKITKLRDWLRACIFKIYLSIAVLHFYIT